MSRATFIQILDFKNAPQILIDSRFFLKNRQHSRVFLLCCINMTVVTPEGRPDWNNNYFIRRIRPLQNRGGGKGLGSSTRCHFTAPPLLQMWLNLLRLG